MRDDLVSAVADGNLVDLGHQSESRVEGDDGAADIDVVVRPEAAGEKRLHPITDEREFSRSGEDDRGSRRHGNNEEDEHRRQRAQAMADPARPAMAQRPSGAPRGEVGQAESADPRGPASGVIQH